MRRRARTDSNHHGVIEALRAAGWTVHDTSRLGDGFCDLVAARHGRIELIEVKDGSKPLSRQQATPAEQRFSTRMLAAGVRVRYVASIDDALAL